MATTTTLTRLDIPKINAGAFGDTFLQEEGTYDHSSAETVTKGGVIWISKNPGKAIIKGAPVHISGAEAKQAGFELQYSSTSQTVCQLSGVGIKFLDNKIRFANPTVNRNDWFVFKRDNILFQGN